jgi:hypothetical protein
VIVLGFFTVWMRVLGGLVDLMPDAVLDLPDIEAMAAQLAEFAGPFNAFAPIEELLIVAGVVMTVLLPAMIAYRTTILVWSLLPFT